MNLDDRLRAAGRALREGSATQVDAAVGLREIVHAGRPQPPDPTAAPAAQPAPPAPAGVLPRTQRLALAVNLLLVLALGVTLVVVAGGARRNVGPGASTPRTAATTPPTSIRPATTPATRTVVQVPEACLEAAELADEIISALTRNERDSRLAMALRDYSVANQACREEAQPAAPPTTAP